MALSNSGENVNYVKLHEREVSPKINKLVFSLREKEGETFVDGKHFNHMGGTLKNVLLGQYEYPKGSGVMIDTVAFAMFEEQENQEYLLKFNLDSFPARSLINKLISAANEMDLKGADVEMNTKTDTEEHHTVFLKVNGKDMKHFFGQDQQPKRREYSGKGNNIEYDATPLNDFYKGAISTFITPHFKSAPAVQNQTSETETEKS